MQILQGSIGKKLQAKNMGNYDCPKCGSKGSLITSWKRNGWDYEVISEKCTVCGYT